MASASHSSLVRATILAVLLTFGISLHSETDQAFQQQIDAGSNLMRAGKYKDAYNHFEQMNKQRGGNCEPCLGYMALARVNAGDADAAMKLTSRALAAASAPHEKADALSIRGYVLTQMAFNGDKKKLLEAEQAYREALALGAKYFHFKLAEVLFLQEKDEEGKKEVELFLREMPENRDAPLARKWLADPRRARLSFAPDFSFTTIDGEQVTLASLAGKTVLIDFWATWCGPCRESLPELKELAKKYPAERFAIISVSADRDAEKWQEFVRTHGMTWKQYRDADDHILRAFNVHAFPTYILIDKEGIIRERVSGLDPRQTVGSRIREPLKKLMQ